jgi:hypothetical protein
MRTRTQCDTAPFQRGAQILVRRRGPPTLACVDLINANAFGFTPVEIGREWHAKRPRRRDKALAQRMRLSADVGDMLGSAHAMDCTRAQIMIFRLDEERQDVIPTPTNIA